MFLDERVVHEDIPLGYVVMASPHIVRRSVPIALAEADFESLVEQPFESTHLDVGLHCSPNSTYCPGNRG